MKPIALFDFDQTIIRQNSLKYLFNHFSGSVLFWELLKSRPRLELYRANKTYPSLKSDIKKTLYQRLISGKTPEQITQAAFDIYPKLLLNSVPVELLKNCVKEDWQIIIVTASPEIYVKSLLKYLEIPFDQIIGSHLSLDKTLGTFTGSLLGSECVRQAKVEYIQKHLGSQTDLGPIRLAVGNLPDDGPMFTLSDTAYHVNKRNGNMIKLKG